MNQQDDKLWRANRLSSMARVTMAAWALLACSAHAQPRPEYSIREESPPTGSHIRRNLSGPIAIPVNLTYEQLSAADRLKFHANYESIAEGDEPPFPKQGLGALLKPITKGQQKLYVNGDLSLVAAVAPSGEVQEVRVHGSPSPEMTRFATQILFATPFKPAVCRGQPCAMEFPLRVRFERR